ncbi:MAG: hypothetical protein JWM41_4983 [Gemmatimonadetes bacterium]|nr:hypothetical protein [Gemmatimonadota bacterium]
MSVRLLSVLCRSARTVVVLALCILALAHSRADAQKPLLATSAARFTNGNDARGVPYLQVRLSLKNNSTAVLGPRVLSFDCRSYVAYVYDADEGWIATGCLTSLVGPNINAGQTGWLDIRLAQSDFMNGQDTVKVIFDGTWASPPDTAYVGINMNIQSAVLLRPPMPTVTPKQTAITVPSLTSRTETFTIANPGNAAASYSLVPSCGAFSAAGCTASPTTITIGANSSATATVSYRTPALNASTATIGLSATYTASAALTDAGSIVVTTADQIAPTIGFAPGGPLTSYARGFSVSFCDADGSLGTPTVTLNGGTLAPSAYYAVSSAGCATATQADFPNAPIRPGSNSITAAIGDGVHTTSTPWTVAYDESTDFTPRLTAPASKNLSPGGNFADDFVVQNPGTTTVLYQLTLSCGNSGVSVVATCSMPAGSMYVAAGQSAPVHVSYSTDGFAGTNAIQLTARYATSTGATVSGSAAMNVTVQPTYTPSVSPKTSQTVGALSSPSVSFSIVNSGTATGTFTLAASCAGAVSNCAMTGPTTETITAGASASRVVSFTAGAAGTTGTIKLVMTAPPRTSGLVEADTGRVAISSVDLNPPGVAFVRSGASPDPGDGTFITVSAHSVDMRVDVWDSDGAVAAPSVTLNGATLSPSSVVVTNAGYNSSKSAYYTLVFAPGNNLLGITASDGVHSTYVEQRYTYNEAPDHNAAITPAHATSTFAINTTATDSFFVRNPGWKTVQYSLGLSCTSDSGACTATSPSGTAISVGAGATAVVRVSFPMGGTVGQNTRVSLSATYAGAMTSVSSSNGLVASVGALLPPSVTLTASPGTAVTASPISLVAVWCDPDDGLTQHTVTWQGSALADTYVAETRAGCKTAGRSTWNNVSINPGAQTAVATVVDAAGHTATASTTVTFTPPVTAYKPAVTPKSALRNVNRGAAESETFTVQNAGVYSAAYTLTGSCGSLPNCAVSPGTVSLAPGASASATVSFTAPSVSGELDTIRVIARYTAASGATIADTGTKSVQYIETTYTPLVTPKTTQTIDALGNGSQYFSIYNNGNAAATFTVAASCAGSISACTLSGGTTVTIDPGQVDGRLVTFTAGAAGTTGTVSLVVTAPPRVSQLVEADTGHVAIIAADLYAPAIAITPTNDPDPSTGVAAPVSLTVRNTTVTVDVSDVDGVVGNPTLTMAGATIAPNSVVATSLSYASSKRAVYTLPFQPGNNDVTVTVSDGVHTSTLQQRYVYDDGIEHAPHIVPLHTTPVVPVGRTVVDTFLVTNQGSHSAAYTVSAGCTFDFPHTPACVANTSAPTITVGAGATVSVPVSYTTDPFVGHHLDVALTATYAGSLSTWPATQQFTATVGSMLPPQVTIAPAGGSTVTSSTINLVVSWCDPDDGLSLRTVTWQGRVLDDNWHPTTVVGCLTSGQSIWNNLPIDPWAQTAVVNVVDDGGHATTSTATITRVAPLSVQQPSVTPKSGSHSVLPNVTATDTFSVTNAGSYAAGYTLTPSCRGVANCVASPSVLTLAAGASAPVVVSYTSPSVTGERDTIQLIAQFTAPTGAVIADTGKKTVVVPALEAAPNVTTPSTPVVLPPSYRSTAGFSITNPGSESVTYAIHTNSTGGFAFPDWFTPPQSVTVDAGQTAFVTLSFAAPNVDGVLGSFTLTADYVSTSGVTLSGSATAILQTQSPQPRIAVTPKTSTKVVDAGLTTTQVGLSVTNTGNVWVGGRATVACSSASSGVIVRCDPSPLPGAISPSDTGTTVSLGVGQSATFLVDVQLRAGFPGRVQLAFDGASDGAPGIAVHDTGTITIRRAGDYVAVAVSPKAESLTVRPGGTVLRRFTITNTGTIPATFYYAAECTGAAVSCATVTGSTGELPPSLGYLVNVTAASLGIGQAGAISVRATDSTVADTGRVAVVTATVVNLAVDSRSTNPGTSVDRGSCLTIAAGDAAAYECGDLRLVHPLPATTTMNKSRALTLVYNSRHHSGIALFAADVTVGGGNDATSLTAHVIVDGKASVDSTFAWDPQWSDGHPRRIVVPVNIRALGLQTGAYHYTLAVDAVSGHSTISQQDTGTVAIVNRATSPFGPGWWLDGLEQLVPYSTTQMLWVGGDGSTRLYTRSVTDTIWTVTPSVDRPDTLIVNAGVEYRRLLRNGGFVRFNSGLQHTATVNAHGDSTTFGYAGPAGIDLRTIMLPVPVSAGRTVSYNFIHDGPANSLSQVVAPAGPSGQVRQTWLKYSTTQANEIALFRIVDPDSSIVAFGYDLHGRLASRTNRRLHQTTYEYDDAGGFRRSTLDMAGTATTSIVRTFCPAETASLTSCASTPFRSDSLRTWYDGPRADGDTTWFYLTRFGSPRTIVDALRHTTRIERMDANWPALVTAVIDPIGHEIRTAYDSRRGLADSVTDVNGNSTTTTTQPPSVTRYEWHAKWDRAITVTSPESVITHREYDVATGDLSKEYVGPNHARLVRYTYDPVTRLVQTVTTLQSVNPTEYGYDAIGNLSRTTTPRGSISTIVRDVLGRDSVSKTPIAGVPATSWRYRTTTYDLMDRVLVSTDSARTTEADPTPQTLRVANLYDAEGNVVQVTRTASPDSLHLGDLVLGAEYDAAHRKTSEFDPNRATSHEWKYDPAGNALTTNRGGDVVIAEYNVLNRVFHRTVRGSINPFTPQAASDDQRFWYDDGGRLVVATNNFAQVGRSYSIGGRMLTDTLRIANADLSTPTFNQHVYVNGYRYDAEGRRIALTPPPGLSVLGPVSYVYDNVTGDLSQLIVQGGGTYRYFYNVAGLLDSLVQGDGSVERHKYDEDGREVARFEFSPALNSYLHADTVALDERGKRLSVSLSSLGRTSNESYTYDGMGGAIATTGKTIEGTPRDALGNALFRSKVGDDFTEHYQYEPHSTRLHYTAHQLGDGTTVDSLSQSYNLAGDLARSIEQITGPQVCTANHDGLSECPPELRRVIAWSHLFNQYDGDGHLVLATKETTNDGSPNWYPSAVRDPNGFAVYAPFERGVLEEYRYDALGRRVWVRAHRNAYCPGARDRDSTTVCISTIERTIYDGDQVLAEIRQPGDDTTSVAVLESDGQAAGRPIQHFGQVGYVHGEGIDHPLELARNYAGDVTRLVLHYQWQGALEIGTTLGGALVQCGLVAPGADCEDIEWPGAKMTFGMVIQHPALGPASWWGTMAGKSENATGMLDMRNRQYDPRTGRFTQEDPIGLAGGMNLYGFASGDPVNHTDPFGLAPEGKCPPDCRDITADEGNRIANAAEAQAADFQLAKTPYVLGGSGSGGSDCIHFCKSAQDRAGLTEIPLTQSGTYEGNPHFRPISVGEARRGDILWQPRGRSNGHVGIFLGDRSSKGGLLGAAMGDNGARTTSVWGPKSAGGWFAGGDKLKVYRPLMSTP